MRNTVQALLVLLPLVLIACATSKKQEVKTIPQGEEDDAPALTKPKIRSFIVPDTIEGNKYIKAHRVYILEDPGSWTR